MPESPTTTPANEHIRLASHERNGLTDTDGVLNAQMENQEDFDSDAFKADGGGIVSCRHVDYYEKLNRIEEGSYGVVYRARNIETGEIVALKMLK